MRDQTTKNTKTQTIYLLRACTTTTVTSDALGDVLPTLLWSSPLVARKYDIVVDVDGDGLYYAENDALDDNDTEVTARFLSLRLRLLEKGTVKNKHLRR